MKKQEILVFGDSITYGAWDKEGGWVSRLRKFLDETHWKEFFIYNLGIPIDETTENVLFRIETELKSRTTPGFENKDIVIFAIGINDSQFLCSEQRHKVMIKKFKENIQELIKLAQNFSSKIIFVGLTPVDESKTTPIPRDTNVFYKNEFIQKYNEVLKSICKENKIYFIELFDKFKEINYKTLLEDGLHPNLKGHQKIFEIVRGFLIKIKVI